MEKREVLLKAKSIFTKIFLLTVCVLKIYREKGFCREAPFQGVPVLFALYPGQSISIRDNHELRFNYVVFTI